MNSDHHNLPSTILAVDDTQDNLYVLEQLIAYGIPESRVLTASSAREGLALAASTGIGCALVDVQMPEIDGIEFCRRLKADPATRDIHVILVTAHDARAEIRTEGLNAGADDFVRKPIDSDELIARIVAVLRVRRAEDALRRTNEHLDDLVRHKTQDLHDELDRRRRTEAALRNTNRIVEASPAVVFEWRQEPDWPVEYVSENVSHLLGYSAAEFRDGSVSYKSLVFSEDRQRVQEEVARFRATPDRSSFEHEPYRVLTRDGAIRWVDDRTVIVRDEDGTILRYQGIVLDVTDRMLAQQRLVDSEANYRRLYDEAPIAYFDVGADARITNCNQAAAKMLRRRKRELVGARVLSLHPEGPEDQSAARAVVSRFHAGEHIADVPLKMTRSDGQLVHVRLTVYTRTDGEGRLLSGRAIAVDVTERSQMEASLAQADRLASMGMLAAGVAHEINNPLTYILYNLESLAMDLPILRDMMSGCHAALESTVGLGVLGPDGEHFFDPELFEDLIVRTDDSLDGVRKLGAIARSLGTFSRVQSDDLSAVDLNRAVESALNMAQNEIKYRARLVDNRGEVPPIWASEGRLSQVVLNLLINAAHAIDLGDLEHNTIEVCTRSEGDSVYVEVRDSGCGIPGAHLSRLFEPFFTTKAVGVGSGLGLAICKKIVDGFGGEISVDTEVGVGSLFVVRLPVGELPGPRPSPSSDHGAEPVARGRILLVDDEPAIRTAISSILRHHEVVAVGSSTEAKATLLEDRSFDLIISDMMMPEMSGEDLHRWLVSVDEVLASRLIFITGGAFTPRARAYLAQTGIETIDKPFDVPVFVRIVDGRIRASGSHTPPG